MRQCPSCQYHVELDWAACRKCGTALPAILEVERVTRPASLPRRTPARPAFTVTPRAHSAPVPRPPSDTLLPHLDALKTTSASVPKRADTWLPKMPSGRTMARHAGVVAAIVSAGLGVRRLLRHRH